VFTDYQQFPSLIDVERPDPGPGEVLLRVAGAGACHSDVAIYREFTEGSRATLAPPFVLGHETSGWVEELGPGVSGLDAGAAQLVYGPIGCGRCKACARGQDPYCENAQALPHRGLGLGRDGGMAEFMTVPARNLVPLGDCDPVAAAPLADAALTPYHAIKTSLEHLTGPGRHALVVGLGGLGQMAVQLLKALTTANVIATDISADALRRAEARGAVGVPAGEEQAEAIRELTRGRGVDAAFDFVGTTPTISAARAVMAQGGRLMVEGIANGAVEWSFFSTPFESAITNSYWGTLPELHDVVDMYRLGQIEPDVERFTMGDALEAYRRLERGELTGRAVVVPHA
jgi:propanol-preferring alcohol dehydrogenase